MIPASSQPEASTATAETKPVKTSPTIAVVAEKTAPPTPPVVKVGKLSRVRKFLASPVKTKFQDKTLSGQSLDEIWITPLTRSEKKLLWACWVTLWLLLIGLACLSIGIIQPKLVEIHFGEAKAYVQQLCKMRPPLNVSSVLTDHPARDQVYGRLLCLSKAVFHMRYGVADETPIQRECEPAAAVQLRDLQTISTSFLPRAICERLLNNTSIVCRSHKFIIEQLCEECSSFASGMRLILLQERMVELHRRGWLSPRTYFEDRTLMVPFDTVLLAYVASGARQNDIVKVMEQALVVTENIAIQDITRPWETIEKHAFDYSAKNVIRNMKLTLGALGMSGNEFYWMLRIENYCAPRVPYSKRESSDYHYMVALQNVLTVLDVPKE